MPQTIVEITRSGPNTPLILTGLPTYQNARFLLPHDANVFGGVLIVDATAQILPGAEAVLRVSLAGKRRAEVLLYAGQATRSVEIELTGEDLAGTSLEVTFSLQGAGPDQICDTSLGIAATVEIEATSALHLHTDGPLTTLRDRVAVWGGDVWLNWPGDLSKPIDADALYAAATLLNLGRDVWFVTAGGAPLDQVLAETSASWLRRRPVANGATPMGQLLDGQNGLFEMRRFQREARWRIEIDFDQLSEAAAPTALELSMVLGNTQLGAQWDVVVAVNNAFAAQTNPSDEPGTLQLTVPLPRMNERRGYFIEIVAQTDFEPEGFCSEGPMLVAQVLPETHLVGGGERAHWPLEALRAAIVEAGGITLASNDIHTPVDARSAARLLASVIDTNLPLGTGADAIFRPAGAEGVAGADWVVFFDDGRVIARPAATMEEGPLPVASLSIDLAGARS